ncbi:MAG: DUF72 domain-containing protein [Nitrospirae bacterium]|nr:MAG: DUF72 domain-containing protein [Nitrospirota bacterium]
MTSSCDSGDALSLRIGTSGWHYPREREGELSWEGVFYPAERPRGFRDLTYYSRFFNTVEVNLTFYRLPRLSLIHSWIRHTPEDFLFSVKLHQKFTHPTFYEQRTFAEGRVPTPITDEDYSAMRAILDTLAEAEKLGCLLIQYGYDVPPTPEQIERVLALAECFKPHRVAIEIRTRGWHSSPDIMDAFRAANLAWVYVDQYTVRYPKVRDVSPTADFYYLRCHGRNPLWVKPKSGGERYDYFYSWDELLQIGQRLKTVLPRVKTGFVYFNNHARAKAAANAMMFQSLFSRTPAARPSETLCAAYPQLEALDEYRGRAVA